MRLLPYGQWAFGESRVQKKSRVLSAEGKIREIREIRVLKNIRVIREIRVQKKSRVQKSRVQSAEGKNP